MNCNPGETLMKGQVYCFILTIKRKRQLYLQRSCSRWPTRLVSCKKEADIADEAKSITVILAREIASVKYKAGTSGCDSVTVVKNSGGRFKFKCKHEASEWTNKLQQMCGEETYLATGEYHVYMIDTSVLSQSGESVVRISEGDIHILATDREMGEILSLPAATIRAFKKREEDSCIVIELGSRSPVGEAFLIMKSFWFHEVYSKIRESMSWCPPVVRPDLTGSSSYASNASSQGNTAPPAHEESTNGPPVQAFIGKEDLPPPPPPHNLTEPAASDSQNLFVSTPGVSRKTSFERSPSYRAGSRVLKSRGNRALGRAVSSRRARERTRWESTGDDENSHHIVQGAVTSELYMRMGVISSLPKLSSGGIDYCNMRRRTSKNQPPTLVSDIKLGSRKGQLQGMVGDLTHAHNVYYNDDMTPPETSPEYATSTKKIRIPDAAHHVNQFYDLSEDNDYVVTDDDDGNLAEPASSDSQNLFVSTPRVSRKTSFERSRRARERTRCESTGNDEDAHRIVQGAVTSQLYMRMGLNSSLPELSRSGIDYCYMGRRTSNNPPPTLVSDIKLGSRKGQLQGMVGDLSHAHNVYYNDDMTPPGTSPEYATSTKKIRIPDAAHHVNQFYDLSEDNDYVVTDDDDGSAWSLDRLKIALSPHTNTTLIDSHYDELPNNPLDKLDGDEYHIYTESIEGGCGNEDVYDTVQEPHTAPPSKFEEQTSTSEADCSHGYYGSDDFENETFYQQMEEDPLTTSFYDSVQQMDLQLAIRTDKKPSRHNSRTSRDTNTDQKDALDRRDYISFIGEGDLVPPSEYGYEHGEFREHHSGETGYIDMTNVHGLLQTAEGGDYFLPDVDYENGGIRVHHSGETGYMAMTNISGLLQTEQGLFDKGGLLSPEHKQTEGTHLDSTGYLEMRSVQQLLNVGKGNDYVKMASVPQSLRPESEADDAFEDCETIATLYRGKHFK